MTRCPHAACHRVAFVCVGAAAPVGDAVALDGPMFASGRTPNDASLGGVVGGVAMGLAFAAPTLAAVREGVRASFDGPLTVVLLVASPAFLTGLACLVATAIDAWVGLCARRRLRAIRNECIAHCALLRSQVHPCPRPTSSRGSPDGRPVCDREGAAC
ncbi:MAG: hypothetical protein AAF721_00800 [Myxococcota bacterium]